MDVAREVSFFDEFEAEHGEYDVLGEPAYRRLLGLFAERVQPREGESCVDLGCGTGAFTRRLGAFRLALSGVDISPRSVESAARLSAHERYLVGDIRDAPLEGESFDIVVYSGVLHHCDERPTRVQILREGFRLLKPGGRLFSYDPSAHSPSMWLYRDPKSPFYSSQGKTENEVLLTRTELAEDLNEVGFSGVTVRGVSGIHYRYVSGRFARMLLPAYNVYETLVRYSPFENWLGTFLVCSGVKP